MRISFISGLFLLVFAACSAPEKGTSKGKNPGKQTGQTEKDSIGVLNWESELCQHKSTFNTRLYREEELRGTLQLLRMTGGVLLEVKDVAFKPDQIADLSSLEELDQEYREKKKQLQNLKIVADAYWVKVKKQLVLAMKDEYDVSRISIQAYTNPNILKRNRFSKICPDLITALTSGDTSKLMAAWKTQVEAQCKHNASPENLIRRFEEESQDPDWALYARIELITFGWNNRVNDQIVHVANDQAINDKFDQLFLETRSECEEP